MRLLTGPKQDRYSRQRPGGESGRAAPTAGVPSDRERELKDTESKVGAISRSGLLALAAALALSAVLLGGSAGASEPGATLWQRCAGGEEDVACSLPRGIGVNPTNGDLYVSDQAHHRVIEYSAWGEFLGAFGWGVADGTAEAQSCPAAASCREGIAGGGAGQFSVPQGIAVETADGVYVFDAVDNRVQKFDAEGHFVLMFGGEVNKTRSEEGGSTEAQRNLCTAASGDVCQAGTQGSGHGQFNVSTPTSSIVAAPFGPSGEERVYVGDKGRIQVFDSGGHYLEDVPAPFGLEAGDVVGSLAAAPVSAGAGTLFLARQGKANLSRLRVSTGAKVGSECEIAKPSALAMAQNATGAPTGDLYAFDEATGRVARFAVSASACKDRNAPLAEGDVKASTGLAAGVACLQGETAAKQGSEAYLSNSVFSGASVRAYGPAPDNPACEKPPLAPRIVAQFSSSVGVTQAQLRAQINPRFYADTTYFVQYGTAACIDAEGFEAPCARRAPAGSAALGVPVADFPFPTPGVLLEGLSPATEYRYRFVALSGGGGPTLGAKRSFATFAPSGGGGSCPNEALRSGPSAHLPDCRAYEMVSPVDKEGGDILVSEDLSGPAERSQSSLDGERFTYASFRAFGEAQSAPLTSQYIAGRGEDGWASENITPPRGAGNRGTGEFDLFSGDLCNSWLEHPDSARPLAIDAKPFTRTLYRRSNCAPRDGEYVAVSPEVEAQRPALKGVSADGGIALLADKGRLAQDIAVNLSTVATCIRPQNISPQLTSVQWLRDGAPIAPIALGNLSAGSKSVTGVVTASGSGTLISGSKLITGLSTSSGKFLREQTIAGAGVPSGAKVARVISPAELELSAAASASGTTELKAGAQPFAAGWAIKGPGIEAGTTIASVSGQTATLSSAATASSTGATLTATATTATYTPSEEDAGHTVQCRMVASSEAGAGSLQDANPAYVVAPYPGMAPPVAPSSVPEPSASGPLAVGGAGGQKLKCDPGAWQGATGFAYRWYRDGAALSGNGAETAEYTVQEADLASPALLQCEAVASNAGGSVAEASEPLATDPAPAAPIARPQMFNGGLGKREVAYVAGDGALRSICVAPGGVQSSQCAVGTFISAIVQKAGGGSQLTGALSEDGAHAFWTDSTEGSGRLYERRNPSAPQSALAHGQATGSGFLTSGSSEVQTLATTSGAFEAGQRISGAGIPYGTTVSSVVGDTLTLSAPATKTSSPSQATPLAASSECTEAAKACTVAVSEAVETRESSSRFWAASPDGGTVLFGSNNPAGSAEPQDLYLFDTATATPTLLAHNTLGVLGQSSDLSRVYFLSSEALNGGKAGEEAGKPNLYLYERGPGSSRFVATLSAQDGQFEEAHGKPAPGHANPFWREARVTPDGGTVAFLSSAAPTGYDNADIENGEADAELFIYDAAAGKLHCASCVPSGARPLGRNLSTETTPLQAAARLPFAINELHPPHVLSDDGGRLFFESFGPLVPADTNGAADVYEWEAAGKGTCTASSPPYSPQDEGCLSLISSGEDPHDSELLDADPGGGNVFFKTGASLVGRDPGSIDVYDARVGGGFPEAQPPVPCEGEACQGPPPPPTFSTPASGAFKGPGNAPAKARRCPKGRRKVRRHGKVRCVRARRAKRHRHRRHHHRAHRHPRRAAR